ncbi:MAG TPA: chalcone isomerase family protein [Kiritimatiellia bacterium]|nr:chalcone isomerase family protein [Kiritimatiellia bacterium]
MKKILMLIAIFALSYGRAEASAKPSYPSVVDVHGARMTLRGEALLRVGYIFRVYWAALHVGEDAATSEVLGDVPKRLEINYLRTISAADLISAGDDALKRQVSAETLAALQPRLDEINSWYRDVKAGDRYTLTYVPGHGSELALNGAVLGVIPGADFASAYFGIWLDPRTDYKDFQSRITGQAR